LYVDIRQFFSRSFQDFDEGADRTFPDVYVMSCFDSRSWVPLVNDRKGRHTHNIVSVTTEGTSIPLESIDDILEPMLYDNVLLLLFFIITTIVRMPSFSCAETRVSRNGDCAYNAVSAVDANVATLIGESDMFDGRRAKTR
jgi:hypothetical protein